MQGMTANQFNLLLRLLYNTLRDIKSEDVVENKDRKIEKLMTDIRKSIDD